MRRHPLDFQRTILQVFRKCISQLENLVSCQKDEKMAPRFLFCTDVIPQPHKTQEMPHSASSLAPAHCSSPPQGPKRCLWKDTLYSSISPKVSDALQQPFPSPINPLVKSIRYYFTAGCLEGIHPYSLLPVKIKVLKLDVFYMTLLS